MAKSVPRELWQYDVFISYARFDDDLHSLVNALTSRMTFRFREATGLDLRIFVDRTDVSSAMISQPRIEAALNTSATLIVMRTPSYYTSTWCQREFDTFLIIERELKRQYELLPYEALIFPILRIPANDTLEADNVIDQRRQELATRQKISLVRIEPATEDFNLAVDRLITDLIPVLQKLMRSGVGTRSLHSTTSTGSIQLPITAPLVTTSAGADDRKLLQLLTDAQSVSIVGITNERLPDLLELAIEQKHNRTGDSLAFWDHLNVVFLSDDLLVHVNDELSVEFPGKAEALIERTRRVSHSRRRLMSLLIRRGVPGHWALYSHPHALPFTGNLFSMPDGKRVVQLQVRRPSRREVEHLHIDFLDRVDQFFESAFQEIIDNSREEHEIVLAGTVGAEPHTFLCRGSKFRRSVLIEGRNTSDWLPAIVAITWRDGRNGPEPLLQINTPKNSTREMGKISHVSGYINYQDHPISATEDAARSEPSEFVIPVETAMNTLRRELLHDFGIRSYPEAARFLGSQSFYYPDKENLFFYMLAQKINSTHLFASETRMFAWTMDDLLKVRHYHVLSSAQNALNGHFSVTNGSVHANWLSLT